MHQRPLAAERRGQRQIVGEGQNPVEQNPGRLGGGDLERQHRVGAALAQPQIERTGFAVGAMQVKRDVAVVAALHHMPVKHRPDVFTENGRIKQYPADRDPGHGHRHRQTRHFQDFRQ